MKTNGKRKGGTLKTLNSRNFKIKGKKKKFVELYVFDDEVGAVKKKLELKEQGHFARVIEKKDGWNVFYRSKNWK